jgi:hypothetical protein
MRIKTYLIFFFLFSCFFCIAAEEAGGKTNLPVLDAPGSAEMAQDEVPQPAPASYGLLMFGEIFLPGSAQIAMGNRLEGALELSLSLPLIGLGQSLIWYYYLAPQNGETSPLLRGDYPYGQDEWFAGRRWMLELGLGLDAAGRAVAAYSAWSAHREYLERYGGGESRFRENLGELVAAPFLPKNVLAFETLPVIALVGLCSFPLDGIARIEDFFASESQRFWGAEVSPGAAFSLKLTDALIVSLFSAIGRELLFRGLILERDGLTASICLSSSYSLLSMVVPGASVGELALRATSEAAYSWYSGALTMKKGRLGQAIALRYWCEASQSVIGYLLNPESSPPLVAGISVRY